MSEASLAQSEVSLKPNAFATALWNILEKPDQETPGERTSKAAQKYILERLPENI